MVAVHNCKVPSVVYDTVRSLRQVGLACEI